jgi:hypothetical protein
MVRRLDLGAQFSGPLAADFGGGHKNASPALLLTRLFYVFALQHLRLFLRLEQLFGLHVDHGAVLAWRSGAARRFLVRSNFEPGRPLDILPAAFSWGRTGMLMQVGVDFEYREAAGRKSDPLLREHPAAGRRRSGTEVSLRGWSNGA